MHLRLTSLASLSIHAPHSHPRVAVRLSTRLNALNRPYLNFLSFLFLLFVLLLLLLLLLLCSLFDKPLRLNTNTCDLPDSRLPIQPFHTLENFFGIMSLYSNSENESLMSFGVESPVSSYSTNRSSSSSLSLIPVRLAVKPSSSKTIAPKSKASSSKAPVSKGKTPSKSSRKATPSSPTPTTKSVPPSAASKSFNKPKAPPTIPSVKLIVPPHASIPEFMQRDPTFAVSHLTSLSIEPLTNIFPLDAPTLPPSPPLSPSPHTPLTTPPITPCLPSFPRLNSYALESFEQSNQAGSKIDESTLAHDEENICGDILPSIDQCQGFHGATLE